MDVLSGLSGMERLIVRFGLYLIELLQSVLVAIHKSLQLLCAFRINMLPGLRIGIVLASDRLEKMVAFGRCGLKVRDHFHQNIIREGIGADVRPVEMQVRSIRAAEAIRITVRTRRLAIFP